MFFRNVAAVDAAAQQRPAISRSPSSALPAAWCRASANRANGRFDRGLPRLVDQRTIWRGFKEAAAIDSNSDGMVNFPELMRWWLDYK
jgi:hypothetical protein